MSEEEKDIVGLKEVTKILNVSNQTLWNYRRNDRYEFPKPITLVGGGQRVGFYRDEVLDWKHKRQQQRLTY